MEKEFVPYEQVSSLIALGFNEPVIAHRQNGLDICLLKQPEVLLTDLSMILYQQAFRWFREKHGICSWIERLYTENSVAYYKTNQEYKKDASSKMHNLIISLKEYNTYEEAELECLKKLIEIVKQKIEN